MEKENDFYLYKMPEEKEDKTLKQIIINLLIKLKKKPEGLKKFRNRPVYSLVQLEKVIAKQKEADAKMCELFARYSDGSEFDRGYQNSANACAMAIRNGVDEGD